MDVDLQREPIATKGISVVITATKDVPGLAELLEHLSRVLSALKRPCEVLLVEESGRAFASSDVVAWKSRCPELSVLPCETPSGEGGATRAGLVAVSQPLVFMLPANSGVTPDVLPRFLERIDSADLVAGVRKGTTRWQRFRQGGSGWWLFGVHLQDIACPVRLYRRTVLGRWPLQSQGPFIHEEIVAKLNFCGALMAEVEIDGAADRGVTGDRSAWRDLRRLFFRPVFLPPGA